MRHFKMVARPFFMTLPGYPGRMDEKEILNAIWGFSYGFTPYLPSIISFFFMKIASIFTTTPVHLLIAARLTSVLAGALTFRIADTISTILEQEAEKVSKDLIHVLVCNEIYKRRHGGRRGMIAFL